MATGWKSLHPSQEERLRALGIDGRWVTQGYGYANASAGTHEPVGNIDGHPFGHCIDLSVSYATTRAHFNDLVTKGFCPFYRDWSGNQHWHLVDVVWIRDDSGHVPGHLSLPRSQVDDFLGDPPRNGLAGHAVLPATWAPTMTQRGYLGDLFRNGSQPVGAGDLKIIYPADAGAKGIVKCRPELTPEGKLRGDLAEFAKALGFRLTYNKAQRKGYVTPLA